MCISNGSPDIGHLVRISTFVGVWLLANHLGPGSCLQRSEMEASLGNHMYHQDLGTSSLVHKSTQAAALPCINGFLYESHENFFCYKLMAGTI